MTFAKVWVVQFGREIDALVCVTDYVCRQISPQRTWNFVEVDVPYEEACAYRKDIIEKMAPLDTVMDLVSHVKNSIGLITYFIQY